MTRIGLLAAAGALVMTICTATQAEYDSAGAAIGNLVQSFKSTR